MNEYLIGLMYHYPQEYELWEKGIIEDYEASTGIYITASNAEQALAWSREIAKALLNYANGTESLTLEQFQHECWLIPNPELNSWSHCLGFFQHVNVNQMPNLKEMTTDAYSIWMEKNA